MTDQRATEAAKDRAREIAHQIEEKLISVYLGTDVVSIIAEALRQALHHPSRPSPRLTEKDKARAAKFRHAAEDADALWTDEVVWLCNLFDRICPPTSEKE